MLRQIILDTETTGLEPEKGHRVIEIGCLEMINRQITGNTFHVYLNPGRAIERGAEEVHGITNAFLADKPKFIDVVTDLMNFINGAELVIHNAPFDVNFLNMELKLTGKRYKPLANYCKIIDTLVIARQKHPGQHNSLDALCRRYHIDNSNRQYHGALLDAELLTQVYLLMTGGQAQLFHNGGEDEEGDGGIAEIQRLAENRPALRVIRPSAEELAAHTEFMQLLVGK